MIGIRRNKPRPPKRRCKRCGGDYYSWSDGKCLTCISAQNAPVEGETLREFRARLNRDHPIGGQR